MPFLALWFPGCALLLLAITGRAEELACGDLVGQCEGGFRRDATEDAHASEDDACALLSVAGHVSQGKSRLAAESSDPAATLPVPLRHKSGSHALHVEVPMCPHTANLLRCAHAPPRDASCFDTPPPPEFRVKFAVRSGESFTVRVVSAWAPVYAQRFWQLVNLGWWNDVMFYRNDYVNCSEGFVSQWGINGNPVVDEAWDREKTIKTANLPAPALVSNTRGRLTFAMNAVACNASAGPADPCAPFRSSCSSTDYCTTSFDTEIYVNYGNNSRLDPHGFAPFGEVGFMGMQAVDSIGRTLGRQYGEVTELCPEEKVANTNPYCVHRNGACAGVSADRFLPEGNAYVKADFPGIYSMRISSAHLVGL